MRSFSDMPLRHKVGLVIQAVTGITVLAMAITLAVLDLIDFRTRAVAREVSIAEVLGINAASAIEFKNPRAARETLAALEFSPEIEGAAVYTADGALFASFVRKSTSETVPHGSPDPGQRFEGKYIEVARPIYGSDGPVGLIYLRSSLQPFYRQMYVDLAIKGAFLVTAMLLALAVTPLLQKFVSGPILQLASLARTVAVQKDYSLRAAVGGTDEVGQLSRDFNQMLKTIQEGVHEKDELLKQQLQTIREAVHEKDELLEQLEDKVADRTARLTAANKELEAFSYSVSHDLRSPLRAIDGFSLALQEDYADTLDQEAKDHLRRIRGAAQRMAQLIDDMLKLFSLTRTEMHSEQLDLSAMASNIAARLQSAEPGRNVAFQIQDGVVVSGDEGLLQQALQNLLDNAWKFTSKTPGARIEFGAAPADGGVEFYVRDNGAGFDMAGVDRLFMAFQRLHSATEFQGTGIGLAIVRRIVHRHGGRVWAEGAVGQGATFHVTLPASSRR